MPIQALAAVATLVSFAVHGNNVDIHLDHGAAQLTWASERTFRFRRTLDGPLRPLTWEPPAPVSFQADDTPGAVRLRSKYIEVSISKRGALVTVRRADGEAVMADLTEPRAESGSTVWDRAMPDGVRYYGLARFTDTSFDLRGKAGHVESPFLLSSAGYAEAHFGAGRYRFDFTSPGRYQIGSPGVDYFFYYGPTPKRIFEERNLNRAFGEPGPQTIRQMISRNGSWEAELLRYTHGAMAGMLSQTFDLDGSVEIAKDRIRKSRTASELSREQAMFQHMRQLVSLVPGLTLRSLEPSDFSKQLKSFFASYDSESRDKGYPLWHPLPFEFPDDPECANHADEFMLGDEMLIAPVYKSDNKRSVYLPPGVWTNLESDAVEQGRRTIDVQTAALPVYARNGAIIPLDSPGGMALHYFPSLGAEFFILEKDVNEWTQIHAAPADDIYRLEIDSKMERSYQWVIHHVEKPASVGFEELKFTEAKTPTGLADSAWFYNPAQKILQIKVRVAAHEDSVIHVTW